MTRIKRGLLATASAVALLLGSAAGAAQASVPEWDNVAKPNATGLMGDKPPTGDPMKMGKQVKGDPYVANNKLGHAGPPKLSSPKGAKLTSPNCTNYQYGVGKQTIPTPPSGVSALFTVAKPYINPVYDCHTLAEIAVQSTDEQQIVEVGWIRQQDTYGDNNVHLFVYHWVNGAQTCYDGCGWVDYAANTTTYAGMSLEPELQTEKIFAIERTSTAWWIGYGPSGSTQWLGSFPDTIWTGATPSITTFKQVNLVQFFGEVLVNTPSSSCADMGAGPTMHVAGTTGAAAIKTATYTGQPSSNVSLNVGSTDSHWPTSVTGSAPYRTFTYGGGGYC